MYYWNPLPKISDQWEVPAPPVTNLPTTTTWKILVDPSTGRMYYWNDFTKIPTPVPSGTSPLYSQGDVDYQQHRPKYPNQMGRQPDVKEALLNVLDSKGSMDSRNEDEEVKEGVDDEPFKRKDVKVVGPNVDEDEGDKLEVERNKMQAVLNQQESEPKASVLNLEGSLKKAATSGFSKKAATSGSSKKRSATSGSSKKRSATSGSSKKRTATSFVPVPFKKTFRGVQKRRWWRKALFSVRK